MQQRQPSTKGAPEPLASKGILHDILYDILYDIVNDIVYAMFLLIPLPVFYILFRCSSLQYFDGGDDILLLLVLLFFLIDVLEPMFDAIFWEIDSERTCNDQKLIVPHRMYYSVLLSQKL